MTPTSSYVKDMVTLDEIECGLAAADHLVNSEHVKAMQTEEATATEQAHCGTRPHATCRDAANTPIHTTRTL